MFLGLQWYWWLAIAAALAISIPFKVRFMRWWSRRRQGKNWQGRWGDGDD